MARRDLTSCQLCDLGFPAALHEPVSQQLFQSVAFATVGELQSTDGS